MDNLLSSIGYIFTGLPFFLLFIGVFSGIIVGSIPGLTTTMLITLTLPLTFFREPVNAITMLLLAPE